MNSRDDSLRLEYNLDKLRGEKTCKVLIVFMGDAET